MILGNMIKEFQYLIGINIKIDLFIAFE